MTPRILLLLIALAVLLALPMFFFAGCAPGGGTRHIESLGLRAEQTERGASGEVTIRFREARDPKAMRPLGLREEQGAGSREIRLAPDFPGAEPLVVTRLEEAR